MKGIVESAVGLNVTFDDGDRKKYVTTIDGIKYDFWSHAIMEKIGQEVEFEVVPSKNPKYNPKGVLTESVQSSDSLTPIKDVAKKWGKTPEESAEIRRMNVLKHATDLIIHNKVRYAKMDFLVALLDSYITTGEFDKDSWDTIKGELG